MKHLNMNHKYQHVNTYCITIAIDYTNAIKLDNESNHYQNKTKTHKMSNLIIKASI